MRDIIFTTLPLIIVAISVILLVNNIKKRNKKRKSPVDNTNDESKINVEDDYMAMGMSLGMCFGVAIASLFINKFGPTSISYGVLLGMLGGILVGMTIKKK